MLLNRHRGLADLHHAVSALAVLVFFFVYAEVTIAWLGEHMKLTREVRMLPYFLSLVIGLLFGWRAVAEIGWKLTRLTPREATGLATRQIGVLALVVFAMMFATQDRSISRLFLGTFLVWTWGGLVLLHLAAPRRLAALVWGEGARVTTIVVAPVRVWDEARRWLASRDHLGLAVVGLVTWEAQPEQPSEPRASWLGEAKELPSILAAYEVSQVLVWSTPPDGAAGRWLVEACQAQGCRILVRHEVDERLGHPVTSVEMAGQPFFTLHDEPLEQPLNRALKRMFDLLVAVPIVIGILPALCLGVKVLQLLQSRGPLLHVRARSGAGGRSFRMLKFRTMHEAPVDELAENQQARAADARVYPGGRFLRRHSLDEFPQFWNVLLGHMSVVGPRPVMPRLDEEFERRARAYRTRRWVKPGITGLAQSAGWRGEVSTPEQLQERVRCDLDYIARWTVWLDVHITFRTLWQVFFPPKSAY